MILLQYKLLFLKNFHFSQFILLCISQIKKITIAVAHE
jgi:hypothetical protein